MQESQDHNVTDRSAAPADASPETAPPPADVATVKSPAPADPAIATPSPERPEARFVHALGRVVPRFPSLAVEREFAQVLGADRRRD
jgi:hypothetical protein